MIYLGHTVLGATVRYPGSNIGQVAGGAGWDGERGHHKNTGGTERHLIR